MIKVIAYRDENDIIRFRFFIKSQSNKISDNGENIIRSCYTQLHYNQVVVDDYWQEDGDSPAYESFECLLIGRNAIEEIIKGRFYVEDLDMSPELLEFAKKGYYDSYREGVEVRLNQGAQDSNDDSNK